MRVILIDDEPLARALVRKYCAQIPEIEIIAECENGFEAVKQIEEKKPDLIFLDVQMPKLNGFEVLELLSDPPAIIFTTAFDEYAVKAFDANAQDYLLKPFLFERFEQAYHRVKLRTVPTVQKEDVTFSHPDEKKRIVIKDGEKITIVFTTDVIYIEAYDDYVKIFTSDGRYLKKQTMSFYEKNLPPDLFVRIHRSRIVAIDSIQSIESAENGRYQVLLTNGVRLPVSRTSFPSLKQRLNW